MAEFKLGRLRFVWKGTWSAASTYIKDDIIIYGGRSYVCLTGHIANADFYVDTANWSIMTDGVTWQGAWVKDTTYKINDIVRVGGKDYICLLGHDSTNVVNAGFYTDLAVDKWELLVDGVQWRNVWDTTTFYNVGDIAKVGGKDYQCITAHTSGSTDQSFFSTDAANWQLMVDGIAWRNTWVTSTFYAIGDVVKFSGKDYLCIAGHTSGTTNQEFYSVDSSNWQLMVDGLAWRNTWVTSTFYAIGDVIKFGGRTYVCTAGHTSGSTSQEFYTIDNANWQLMNDGFAWAGTLWQTSHFYALNDIVRNGGKNYICIAGHTSSSTLNGGFNDDLASNRWTLYTDGVAFAGEWTSSYFYKLGDLAKYGGLVYQCSGAHTSQAKLELDQGSWTVFVPGFNWIEAGWETATTYKVNDLVKYGPDIFICTTAHTSSGTTINLTNFAMFVQGLEYQNSYDAGTSYVEGDVISYGGYVYASTETNNLGNLPSSSSIYWALVTTGFNIRGVWDNVSAYKTGDVITYGAYVYVALLDSTGTNPSTTPLTWSLLTTGLSWQSLWSTGTAYKLGDAIGYASNSYVCVQAHTSSTPTRPDNDILGDYWNALAQGAATNVTTTRGDLIYYSASGNARLPIGTDGQVLRVSGLDPTWATYGVVTDLYYVAPNGTDSAGYGVSIDKPWRTIAYACAQIDSGIINTNAQFLLNANKTFIAAEVDNYLSYTYTVSVTGSNGTGFTTANTGGLTVGMPIRFSNLTGSLLEGGVALSTTTTFYVKSIITNTSFTISRTYLGADSAATGTGTATGKYYYNSASTLRDADYIVDSLLFDIGRGGSLETTVTALTYFSGETTYASTAVLQQKNQIVAGLNYISTILANILANTPPASNYQTLNGVGSPVAQTINLSYTAEAGTTTTGQSLVSIVTTGLNEGTTLAIPLPNRPNVAVMIKTGTYNEVLPISVPAFTSLVGDELRTVVVQPYTFAASAVSSSGTTLIVSDATGIVDGMGIVGNTYIPDGTMVQSHVGTTLTLNQPTTGNVIGTVKIGYNMSNMFYMRDGTGARNMSVKGLYGGLTSVNAYGTKRPTGGSYFSLDPGDGTTDETVWINSRSPYMQNISLFGAGCIGMKIDGSLHNGGNKSMVCNDFTNILSDGLAIWCTNLALCEAVSVFSYYGYAGYLSELGGKIRATNGNSSYGTYGCVAEGGNPSEVAITGTVNTRATQAAVSSVLLGGGQVLWLEYSNAGEEYSAAVTTVYSSTGVGATYASQNIYTNAITEVRIITGGTGYSSAVNNAQTGNASSLTLSAADIANTASYNGMRIVLTDGTGAGQYGYIAFNNGGTKVANILKESFVALTTSSCSSTTFSVADTTTIPVGSTIVFTGTTFGGVTTLSQIYYVVAANFTSTTFSVATSSGGTEIALSPASGTMGIQLAGWDVAVTGTSVITNLDFTTRYIIEPRVTFTSGSGSGALVRAKVLSGVITEFRIINPGSGYLTTPTIVITDPNVTSAATVTVRKQATGVLGQPTWTSRGSGYKDATAYIVGNGYADIQPVGYFINLSTLTDVPVAGANLVFAGNPVYYTVVQVLSSSGTGGNFNANVQVNPAFTATDAPLNGDSVTATIQYSQVRLTGHDFLYVGSGNFGSTGYPNNFSTANHIQSNETINSAGGRVFFTSTDQDGNFRVGGLFTVQQATGVATLNANLFNLSGLNALQFASGGASVTQFSTDATFSANSDVIVPTQRAIKAFLASQLGAGGAVLAVSSLTSGNVIINGNQITTQNAVDLNITAVSGNLVQMNTGTNLNAAVTLTASGTLAIATGASITAATGSSSTFAAGSAVTFNGVTTQNAIPVTDTDVTNKKYVDRVLSLNTMWTNAW